MSVSNVRLLPASANVKAGETIRFSLYWEGTPEYQYWVGDVISVQGAGDFKGLVNIRQAKYTDGYFGFSMKTPNDWAGTKTGWFNLAWIDSGAQIVADTATSPKCTVRATGVMNPVISISPANSTIRPGGSAVMTANVSGIEQPYTVESYKWVYDGKVVNGNTPTITIPWKEVGTKPVVCELVIKKDGYSQATASGSTNLTMAKGTMDGVSVMIDNIPASVKIFGVLTGKAKVTGAPEGATISYEWKVSGVSAGKTDTLDFKAPYVTTTVETPQPDAEIQVIVSVVADNYDGATIESPVVKVPVIKLDASEINPVLQMHPESFGWGPGQKLRLSASANVNNNYVNIDETKPYSMLVDGKNYFTSVHVDGGFALVGDLEQLGPMFVKDNPVTASVTVKQSFYNEAGPSSITGTLPGKPYIPIGKSVMFFINDQPVIDDYFAMKELPGKTITFKITNVLDPKLQDKNFRDDNPLYTASMNDLGKQGVYDLLDFENNVVATAVDGEITVTLPNEEKTIKGTLRHRIDNPELFKTPYEGKQTINFELVPNPMVPKPTLELTQSPHPVVLGNYARIERTFGNIPNDANADKSVWTMNDEPFGESTDISVIGAHFDKFIKNTTTLTHPDYDDTIVTSSILLEVVLKPWPAITLEVTPAKTVVPWGDLLTASYKIIGTESMDDQDKLVSPPPTWYLDGVPLHTLAEDGSLQVRAIHPGDHVIKAVVKLTHPDYENGEKVVEQSFNMTTEKRPMATKLELLPVDPKIIIGKTQKFTATVSDAPADATITYKWEVDSVVQNFTQNFMDYTPDSVGAKVIKVTSTTKAQDAEDDVQTATTTLTVEPLKDITAKVDITVSPLSLKIGESYTGSITVTDAPSDATITYKWSTGETTKDIARTADKEGKISIYCDVSFSGADGYADKTIKSDTKDITVTLKEMTGTVSVVGPDLAEADSDYTLIVQKSGLPDGATFTYLWDSGETTETITVTKAPVGTKEHSVKVTAKAKDFSDKEFNASHSVKVEEKTPEVPDECPLINVHPLPSRNSAYIWCGWWVMDAIEKLTDQGKDWKTATKEDSKYYCHLNVLAKMLVDFPEVDVQESRNGRIVHKSALEIGIIY